MPGKNLKTYCGGKTLNILFIRRCLLLIDYFYYLLIIDYFETATLVLDSETPLASWILCSHFSQVNARLHF